MSQKILLNDDTQSNNISAWNVWNVQTHVRGNKNSL